MSRVHEVSLSVRGVLILEIRPMTGPYTRLHIDRRTPKSSTIASRQALECQQGSISIQANCPVYSPSKDQVSLYHSLHNGRCCHVHVNARGISALSCGHKQSLQGRRRNFTNRITFDKP